MKLEIFNLIVDIKRVPKNENTYVSVRCFGCGADYKTQIKNLRTSNYCHDCAVRIV